jgi:DNA polymerase elongation subunit (family B)
MDLFITEWMHEDIDSEYVLRAFGRNTESVIVDIYNFYPSFYVELPQDWNKGKVSMFIYHIESITKRELRSFEIVHKKPLSKFTGTDNFKYVKLNFNNYADFKKWSYLLGKEILIPGLSGGKPTIYQKYESNISPMLRGIHDTISIGWITITKMKKLTIDDTINTKAWYSCDVANIRACSKTYVPPLIYLSFDIEADSSHADFPIANKRYTKLAREMLVEYARLYKINQGIQTKKRNKLIKGILQSYIQLAFNNNYANNGISYCGCTDDLIGAFDISKIYSAICTSDHEAIAALLQDNISNIYDFTVPAKQLVQECARLTRINNVRFSRAPKQCIALMLQLLFDPNYINCNFNNVYTVGNEKPKPDVIAGIMKQMMTLCAEHIRYKQNKDTENADIVIDQLTKLYDDAFPEICGDEIIQIGSVFKRYGEQHPYLKHIIALWSCDDISNDELIADENKDIALSPSEIEAELAGINCDNRNERALESRRAKQAMSDHAEVRVVSVGTEEELLLEWIKIVIEEDPDLILGYNIFDFDYKYIYARAKVLGIEEEFNRLGRAVWTEERDAGMSVGRNPDSCVFKEQGLSSSAFGDNTLYYLQMYGRISIDLYKLAQISFKLDSYKLDSVCKIYLGKSKNDLPPTEIFIKQKGTSADRGLIAKYCIMDCILVTRLFDKLDIFINNYGMAQVCSVPLSYLFLRGQGIKLLSFVSKIAAQKGFIIPVLQMIEEEDREKYEGAIVLNPVSNIYFEPIVVADFNSLYPSCMISENLSHDSYVSTIVIPAGKTPWTEWKNKLLEEDNEYERKLINGEYEGWTYVDIMYDLYKFVPICKNGKEMKKMKKVVSAHKICRFAQPPHGGKSIIPTILIDLLQARKDTRKKQGACAKNSFEWNVLEGMQLAYKTTANSLYGQIGSPTSAIRLIDISACTTSVGRTQITIARDFCESNYSARVVYGDTDSIFIKFDTVDVFGNKLYGLDAVFASMLLCTEAALAISNRLKRPHNLEMEKAIWPFILVTKKRYVGNYYTSIYKPSCYRNANGIALKRRDNAKILKHIFGNMIDIIMTRYSIEEAITYIKKECEEMLAGKFPIEYFVFSKTLRGFYKNPSRIAHKVLADRIGTRDPGNKPRSNDRIHYAFIKNDSALLQGDKIETPEFIITSGLKINYELYLTNQLEKPLSQIIALHSSAEFIKQFFDRIKAENNDAMLGVRKLSSYSKFGKQCETLDIVVMTRKQILSKITSDEAESEEEEEINDEDDDELEIL